MKVVSRLWWRDSEKTDQKRTLDEDMEKENVQPFEEGEGEREREEEREWWGGEGDSDTEKEEEEEERFVKNNDTSSVWRKRERGSREGGREEGGREEREEKERNEREGTLLSQIEMANSEDDTEKEEEDRDLYRRKKGKEIERKRPDASSLLHLPSLLSLLIISLSPLRRHSLSNSKKYASPHHSSFLFESSHIRYSIAILIRDLFHDRDTFTSDHKLRIRDTNGTHNRYPFPIDGCDHF